MKQSITIDLAEIETIGALHAALSHHLEFPHFYGMNWDAFWDAITGLVEMPKKLVFKNCHKLKKDLPEEFEIMLDCLKKMNEIYPNNKCEVYLE